MFVEYRDRKIQVTVAELVDGGYGIQNLSVLTPQGPSDVLTPLLIVEPLKFRTEEEARRAGLLMAQRAIDDGTV